MGDKVAETTHPEYEDRLEHLNTVLRAIRNVNQLITRETDRNRLLQGLCNKLVETRGYNNAWIVLQDEAGRFVSATSAGLDGKFGVMADQLEQGWLPPCASRALSASKVVVINHPPSECRDCPLAYVYPDKGALSTQLEYQDRVYGNMTVSIPTRFIDDAEELDLFAEVAGDISFALYRVELEERHRQVEKALQEGHAFRTSIINRAAEGLCVFHQVAEFPYVKFTVWNDRMTEITGYSMAEINRLGWYQTMYPDPETQLRAEERMGRMRPGHDLHSEPWEVTRADGEKRVLKITTSILKTDDGMAYTLALMEDITEQKRAEEALRESEERFSRVIEASNTGVWEWNIAQHLVYFSPRWKNLLGYEDHEMPNKFEEWENRLHPDDKQRMLQAVAGYLERPAGNFSHEFRMRHKDGSYRWILNRSAASIGDDGKPVTMYGSHLDITESKRAEEEIRRRNRELTLLNRVIAASVARTEPNAILEVACRELARVFDVPQAAAALLNHDRTEAVVVAEYLAEGRPSAMNTSIPVLDNPTFQYILAHKNALVVENAYSDPRLASVRALVHQRGTVSLLVLPLVIEEEVVGTLGMDAIEPRSFSVEELHLAQNVAAQVSGSLARARLEEDRRRLEEQYHQAQKMESLGRLTGGVAHDFNNLLTAINGFAELMQMRLPPDDPQQSMVSSILDSGQRAADLVRQLLAFSRKQIIEPKILDLNAIVANMDKMLRRVIGEDIQLKTVLAPDLWSVKIDPTQLEQIVVNLAVNARDAMPHGGRLTIETANVFLDEAYLATHVEAQVGQHVRLAISDSGVGISDEAMAQIFEPFFTTKELGRGTGLGLATVHGIVKQNGGDIQVYSEQDVGTTFKVYLPSAVEIGSKKTFPEIEVEIPTGHETVLLVEDDANVRSLIQRVLQSLGYNLLEAEGGQEALQIAAGYDDFIHLLLTDVVMPDINGKMLAEELLQTRPDLKVLFMSGYTDNAIAHHGVLDPDTAFVQKPFSPTVIAHRIREVLDE